jgi:hypothetical protein
MPEPDSIWSSLTQPNTGLRARHHPTCPDVWLALDSTGHRHLLVRAVNGDTGETLLTTRGLRAALDRLSFEDEREGVWADITCLEPALNDTFVAVADDLANEILHSDGDLLAAVRRTLRTWQWFWGIDPNRLSTEAEIGLFGELWFLERWAPFPDAIETWLGPTGHRHDFSAPRLSVEVKATRTTTDGPARHRIANLDQLDAPETGRLLLFSLQVVADPNAANTLPVLVERINRRLQSRADLLGVLNQRLAQVGWTPAAVTQHPQRWRIVAEELYTVSESFPRLTRATFATGIPAGIDEIGYTLDLAACAPWRAAARPTDIGSILSGLHL